MRKQFVSAIGLVLAMGMTTLMVGCADNGSMSKQNVGVASGAVLGGLLGSQFGYGQGAVAAAVGGALLGGLIGGAIGQNMDNTDQMRMQNAMNANRSNQTAAWRNPDTGNAYQVTPQQAYRGSSGQPCREYTTTATIGGKRQQVYGTACRQADGSWQTVSQ
jgi:surface antigen